MVGLCATGHYVLVCLVMGGFELADLLRHCWEGSVVDPVPTIDYCLGYGAGYF